MRMKSNQPLISVIIPVYNIALYLPKCLESVCNQTYQNLEIICVNDGSTDNSAEILAQYAARDSRIIVINQENAGMSVARNVGIERATGEWITGIDGDDYIELDAYEYCLSNNALYGGAKLIIFSFDTLDGESGKRLNTYKQPTLGLSVPTAKNLYATDCYFWNKLWHRDLFKKSGIRFPENMWFEDVAVFYFIAPYLDHILYLPEVKAHYMRYASHVSTMDKARAMPHKNLERVRAVELACQYYSRHPLPEHLQQLAPGMLLHFYNQLRVYLTPDIEQPAWNLLREIIQKYHLLPSLADNPELTLCYYLPPCALNAHNKQFVSMYEFELLLINRRLKKRFYLLFIKKLLLWGKARCKIVREFDLVKQQLRWLRFRKRHVWKSFIASIK